MVSNGDKNGLHEDCSTRRMQCSCSSHLLSSLVQGQRAAAQERAETKLGRRPQKIVLSPKPLSRATRRESAGRKRRPESPNIAALKAAIVAATAEGYVKLQLGSGLGFRLGSGLWLKVAACNTHPHGLASAVLRTASSRS